MSDSFALARARRALAEAGLDHEMPLERASSVTNEVWLTSEYVVRVNRRISPRLRREAEFGPLLPPEVGYPEIVAYGGELGADWLVIRRVPGKMLSHCWPTMTTWERRSAVRQLAVMIRALHATPVPPGLGPAEDVPHLLDPAQLPIVAPLLDALDVIEAQTGVEPGVIADTRHLVLASTPALDTYPTTYLIHGDLHFQNVLWDGFTVTALIDFEWSRGAPADLELDVLLRFCGHPDWHVAPEDAAASRPADYAEVASWFKEDYPEMFSRPYLFERLLLYEISYDVTDLTRELATTPITGSARDLPLWHPYHRLTDALRGRSHLHRFAGYSTWDSPDEDWASDQVPPLARP